MIRVHVFCEGQTEDVFVREILQPHFDTLDIWLNPIIIRTGTRGKGGASTYGKIKWQIERKCKEDPSAWVTTMLDFYGLPKDFPVPDDAHSSSMDKAERAVQAFQQDIGEKNFIPFLVIHEFEGLLFSSTPAFASWFDNPETISTLSSIRSSFPSPEHINDGRETAPSKRIMSVCRRYDKVLHGSLIALDIGLDTIRSECPIFDAWVLKLESLAGG